MTTQIFVISWTGQHLNASEITAALDDFREDVAVVFSDQDESFVFESRCRTIRRPNHLFWADKFLACLEACTADRMLILHGDCQCDDWAMLVRKCDEAFARLPGLGVWAPVIKGSFYEIENTRITRLGDTPYSLVTHYDAICFALSRAIVHRMRQADYSANLYGWGISGMMIASAYSRNMLVVVDESTTVRHPAGRGYPSEEAKRQREAFLEQLSIQEKIQRALLTTYGSLLRSQRERGYGGPS